MRNLPAPHPTRRAQRWPIRCRRSPRGREILLSGAAISQCAQLKEKSKLGTRSWVIARKTSLDNLTDAMNGPGDEVEQPLVDQQAGPRPAPAGAVQGDEDSVARKLFERSKHYERVRFKH